MPGSAGGHSGGFSGGGHSGGFSGGGHSGSFGGGSHGGFSGGSRSGGGFHSPNPGGGFHPHGGMGGGFYPWGQGGRRRRSGGGGCLSGILGILLLPLALVIFAVFAFTNLFGGSGSYTSTPDYYYDESVAMSSELVTYEKLSDSLCTPIEACVETDISDLLNEEGEAQIQRAIDYFYETTGVQPYFMLLGGINGDSDPDYDTIDNFLYNKYVSMFPEDEGHIILLMLLDGDDYTTWYIIGDDAYFVTDEYACETILNNIDYYAAFTDSTDIASVIADALTDTADDIMTDVEYFYSYPADYDYNFDRDINGTTVSSAVPRISGLIFITVIIAVIVFAVWLNKKHKNSAPGTPSGSTSAQGEKSYRQVNTDNTSTGSYDSRSYSPNKAAYPVRCPYCGATAYPKDDGTCEYCGSKLPE